MNKKAIILFSGGLDSTTCLAIAKSQGFLCHTLSFDYGQKHCIELTRAKSIAAKYAVAEHKCLALPLADIRGSSLTDINIPVKDHQPSNDIPDKKMVMTEMQKKINIHLNPLFKIHDVIFRKELPKTASNKIMRRILRKECMER